MQTENKLVEKINKEYSLKTKSDYIYHINLIEIDEEKEFEKAFEMIILTKFFIQYMIELDILEDSYLTSYYTLSCNLQKEFKEKDKEFSDYLHNYMTFLLDLYKKKNHIGDYYMEGSKYN